jgi:hypothetical protein
MHKIAKFHSQPADYIVGVEELGGSNNKGTGRTLPLPADL